MPHGVGDPVGELVAVERLGEEAVDLAQRPGGLGGALGLRDIHHDPVQPASHAVVVRDDVDEVAEPHHAAVGGDHPVLELVILQRVGLEPHPEKAHTVVGMQVGEPEVFLGVPAFHGIAQDRLGRVAHVQGPPRRRVGLPDDGGEALRELSQALL